MQQSKAIKKIFPCSKVEFLFVACLLACHGLIYFLSFSNSSNDDFFFHHLSVCDTHTRKLLFYRGHIWLIYMKKKMEKKKNTYVHSRDLIIVANNLLEDMYKDTKWCTTYIPILQVHSSCKWLFVPYLIVLFVGYYIILLIIYIPYYTRSAYMAEKKERKVQPFKLLVIMLDWSRSLSHNLCLRFFL